MSSKKPPPFKTIEEGNGLYSQIRLPAPSFADFEKFADEESDTNASLSKIPEMEMAPDTIREI
jgi:hypothetical protein